MGEKLLKYYKHMKDVKGGEGLLKLAMQTKIPITKAAMENDSPENIKRFREAIKAITGKDAPMI